MILTEHVLDTGAVPVGSTTDTDAFSPQGEREFIRFHICIFDGPEIGSTGGLGRVELSGASSVNARKSQMQTKTLLL